jgi:hypothetical protein
MNPVIPILLTVFLCFFLLLVTCVLCIFATAIRLLWQAAPILANLRSPDRRTMAWRVIDADAHRHHVPPHHLSD